MRAMDECVAYFKKNGGFTRLMEGLYDLYMRYERCYGAVRLVRPTPEEEKAISDFFKRDYYNQALIRIGLADFERQAQKVLSPDIRLEALLEAYLGKRLTHKSGPRIVNAFTLFIENDLILRYMGTDAENWLREVSSHVRRAYRVWSDQFTHDPKAVETMLTIVCGALNNLPDKRRQMVRLADFSEQYTGDEHMLSRSGAYGPLFLRALTKKYEQAYPTTPEECSALYFKAGLLSEGVLNCVTVRGLLTRCGEEPDEATAFYDRINEPYVLTLENLTRFTQVEAHGGKVFIMENLTVFSAVSERLRNCKCTMICHAPDNPALTRLLDLLAASQTAFYYSGDMDYAGLCLADKIYLAYPKRFKPWRYGKADYERVMSENDFYLPDNKKEIGLHNDDLAALLSLMRKRGKTAAQTALIPYLLHDINEMCPPSLDPL